MICNSFEAEFELIVITVMENVNKIYHLKNRKYQEIEDFVDIGSG
jgi:hypothetical protein